MRNPSRRRLELKNFQELERLLEGLQRAAGLSEFEIIDVRTPCTTSYLESPGSSVDRSRGLSASFHLLIVRVRARPRRPSSSAG